MQSQAVAQMGQIEITGNVIPAEWFQRLTLANGKPNLPAIIILSDLVYWYKPMRQRNEETGKPLPPKQRFKADKLQRSYGAIAEQYGFGKEQVRDACHYLESRGLITLEFRTVDTGTQKLSNVMFPEIVPAAVREITHAEHLSELEEECSTDTPIGFHTDTLSGSTDTPIGFHTDTYTENSTGITTKERESARALASPAVNPFNPETLPTVETELKAEKLFHIIHGGCTLPPKLDRKIERRIYNCVDNLMLGEFSIPDVQAFIADWRQNKSIALTPERLASDIGEWRRLNAPAPVLILPPKPETKGLSVGEERKALTAWFQACQQIKQQAGVAA